MKISSPAGQKINPGSRFSPLKAVFDAMRGPGVIALLLILLLSLNGCAFTDALGHYLHPSEQEAEEEALPAIDTPVAAPTAIAQTPEACQRTIGTVTRIEIPSEALGEELTASIYTPPCYDPVSGSYPVLYLLHGQSQDDTFWYSLGAAQIVDQAIAAGRRPFIMVMPYEEDAFAPVTESKFDDAFIDDLIPYVESHYAVCTERTCRAIGGISHGAGWAVHIALMHIDLFSSVGAHSVGYFAGDSIRIGRLAKTMTPDEFPRFYVDRGENDYLKDDIDALDRVLTVYHIPHEYVVSPGSHAASYWKAHVTDYLNWYMDGWDPQP